MAKRTERPMFGQDATELEDLKRVARQAPGPPELTGEVEQPTLEDMPDRDARERTQDAAEVDELTVDEARSDVLNTGIVPEATSEKEARVRLRSPLALERLRERLKDEARRSGYTYDEIGERMGIPKGRFPAQIVSKLLNQSPDPGVFMLMRFCSALGIKLADVLPEDLDPTR